VHNEGNKLNGININNNNLSTKRTTDSLERRGSQLRQNGEILLQKDQTANPTKNPLDAIDLAKMNSLVDSNILKFNNTDISNVLFGKSLRRHTTVSPEKSLHKTKDTLANCSSLGLASKQKYNESRLNHKPNIKIIPASKKQRSHSENGKRIYDANLAENEPEYFTNKLKSTIGNDGFNKFNQDFFARRKANQNTLKVTEHDTDNPFSLLISLSEKKPKSDIILLNDERIFNVHKEIKSENLEDCIRNSKDFNRT